MTKSKKLEESLDSGFGIRDSRSTRKKDCLRLLLITTLTWKTYYISAKGGCELRNKRSIIVYVKHRELIGLNMDEGVSIREIIDEIESLQTRTKEALQASSNDADQIRDEIYTLSSNVEQLEYQLENIALDLGKHRKIGKDELDSLWEFIKHAGPGQKSSMPRNKYSFGSLQELGSNIRRNTSLNSLMNLGKTLNQQNEIFSEGGSLRNESDMSSRKKDRPKVSRNPSIGNLFRMGERNGESCKTDNQPTQEKNYTHNSSRRHSFGGVWRKEKSSNDDKKSNCGRKDRRASFESPLSPKKENTTQVAVEENLPFFAVRRIGRRISDSGRNYAQKSMDKKGLRATLSSASSWRRTSATKIQSGPLNPSNLGEDVYENEPSLLPSLPWRKGRMKQKPLVESYHDECSPNNTSGVIGKMRMLRFGVIEGASNIHKNMMSCKVDRIDDASLCRDREIESEVLELADTIEQNIKIHTQQLHEELKEKDELIDLLEKEIYDKQHKIRELREAIDMCRDER